MLTCFVCVCVCVPNITPNNKGMFLSRLTFKEIAMTKKMITWDFLHEKLNVGISSYVKITQTTREEWF